MNTVPHLAIVNNEPTRATPFSVELEQALLGGLILNPARLADIVGLVAAADFYRPDHALLFTLLVEMNAAGIPIEPVTVQERVARGGKANRYGGIPYVVELPDQAPSTANLDYYARRIAVLARCRAILRAGERLCALAEEAPDTIEVDLDATVADLGRALAEAAPLCGAAGRRGLLSALAVAIGRDEALAAFRAAFSGGAR